MLDDNFFYFDFVDSELVHEMNLGSNKRKKVSDSSIRKLKKVNIGAEIFKRVQMLEDKEI